MVYPLAVRLVDRPWGPAQEGLVGVVLLAWWWFFRSRMPYRHRHLTMDGFEWLLDGLMDTMRDGSVLVIEHEGSDRFIQFVKYERPSGVVVSFAFPDAPWSREYFDSLRMALADRSIDYSVSETGDEMTRRFLEVECKGDPVESALELAGMATAVMDLGDGDRFCAHLTGDLDSEAVVSQSAQAIHSLFGQRG